MPPQQLAAALDWHVPTAPFAAPDGGKWFVEVFAGAGNLTMAVASSGAAVLPPIDIVVAGEVRRRTDILEPGVFQHLQQWVERISGHGTFRDSLHYVQQGSTP